MSKADKLLDRIVDKLRANRDVQAVWLSGSYGRGTADEFSDLDIWIAIDDAHIAAVNSDPLAFVETISPTIMHVNAPSIAPTGGSFLGSWLPTRDTFVQVDWYFTPSDSAERDPDTRLVFGEIPIRGNRATLVLSEEDIAKKIHDNLVMALQRINLMVKRYRRGDTWGAANAARNADLNLVTANVLTLQGVNPGFEHREQSFLESPVPTSTNEAQNLATHLLKVVLQLASNAEKLPVHQPAVEVMQRVIQNWQDSVST